MSGRITEYLAARMDIDLERMRLESEEMADAEACGEELYYDMSDAKVRGVGCDPDCREGCEESHTILVGRWRRRAISREAA